jgi:hypothetical protein
VVVKDDSSPTVIKEQTVALVIKEENQTDSAVMDNRVSSNPIPIIADKHIIEKVDDTPVQQTTDQQTEPSRLLIDTEPSVHFTPYDTVYDENNANISEIRYTPKLSVEEKPPSMWGLSDYEDDNGIEEIDDIGDVDLPRLNISDKGSELTLDDMEDLDAPRKHEVEEKQFEEEIDDEKPLADLNDFEELA